MMPTLEEQKMLEAQSPRLKKKFETEEPQLIRRNVLLNEDLGRYNIRGHHAWKCATLFLSFEWQHLVPDRIQQLTHRRNKIYPLQHLKSNREPQLTKKNKMETSREIDIDKVSACLKGSVGARYAATLRDYC